MLNDEIKKKIFSITQKDLKQKIVITRIRIKIVIKI
jgi:hypothetical protein